MYVKVRDIQPLTLLHSRPWPRGAVVAGLFCTVGAHLAVALLAIWATHATNNAAPPKSYIEENVVEARLVRLGKPPDKKKLPQKKVPRKTTAPKDSVAVSKKEEPKPPPEKKKPEPPKEAEEDPLARLGDRAQAFAQIAEEREREGDPEGDPEGDALEAQAGDRYAGQLTAFFKRGWTIPTTLGDTSNLMTVANVTITRDLHVGDFQVVESSGEPLFDQSVEDRLHNLQQQGTTLPEPPLEVARRFLGQTITIRFTDKR